MDCLVVLEVSRCSGHARRISLWKTLKNPGIHPYLRQKFENEKGDFQDLTNLLDEFFLVDSFSAIWRTINSAKRELLVLSFRELLKTLRFTGVGEDKYLQAWDITSHERIDGRRLHPPRWSSFFRDDIGSATFTIITETCVRYSQDGVQPVPGTVLQTRLCITTTRKLDAFNAGVKQDDIKIGEFGSSSSATFSSRWSVQRSQPTDIRFRRSPHTVQFVEERDLFKRIRESQRIRRMSPGSSGTYNSAEQFTASTSSMQYDVLCTGNDTPAVASRYPFNDADSSKLSDRRCNTGEKATCNTRLSFRNGKGQKVGKLLLEPLQGPTDFIDLNSLTDTSALPARWEEVGLGLLDTLHEKKAAWDKSI